ncbi:hypothetical protein TEA_028931 [Camellia sinensis var. sinensis]|uniref:Arp2/3 complex 34 kDa subunit n=1 Tax=Camellia sinensis var. sinensis TaxID=542762 RepID=A0A4S4EIS8_CAMSN|nr:hypothetical protein TEA_028931 [Camellia sinensis var. sinensis]
MAGGMACFERASPALKQILLKLYSAEKPMELDHHLHEFGSVEYHIQIVEPAREGYQLTLKLDFARIPHGKESMKIITEISTVQSVILSSQLKEILRNISSQDAPQGIYRPIKLVYHPREPFFVIKQPAKITVVFPMRFKENTDVIIATAFFQELMDVGSSKQWAKAPPCTWSPIPPPELRGEHLEDLSTNGGFATFDISSRHVEGKKLDKTVWSLLNFYAFVKNHVKCTRSFIQRRMRNRLESLVEVLRQGTREEDQHIKKVQVVENTRFLMRLSQSTRATISKHEVHSHDMYAV